MLKFSAVINCFNEEDFIAIAVKSIAKYVDEIVIVDNCSTDKTVSIVTDLILNPLLFNKIRLFALDKPMQLADARNFALSKASHEWVIKWDGDFCAFDEMDPVSDQCASFQSLLDIVNDTHNDFDIYLLYSLNLSGDLFHYDKTRKYLGLSGDSFVGRKSCMLYVADDKYGDIGFLRRPDGNLPRFYYRNNPEIHPMHFLHVYGVKNDYYLLYRMFMSEYQVWLSSNDNIPFWDWMKRVKNYDAESGINYVKSKLLENLDRHNIELPHILKSMLHNIRYEVTYDGDKISGRLEKFL